MSIEATIPTRIIDQFLGNELKLWIIGFVDYVDIFTIRRRAGYARRVLSTHGPKDTSTHRIPCDTFPLVFEKHRDYNYDRERQHGEGDDWDEPQPNNPG
jgi:hypothetical protein